MTITIFCTDRGRHRRWIIERDYWANQIPRGAMHVFRCGYHAGRGDACRRNEQVTIERWPIIAAGLAELGIAEIDISDFPHPRG